MSLKHIAVKKINEYLFCTEDESPRINVKLKCHFKKQVIIGHHLD